LSEHQREKHADELSAHNSANKKLKVTPTANRSAVVVVSSSNGSMNAETASAVASITGAVKQEGASELMGTPYTPVRGRRPAMAPANVEFKCTFPDCGFVTNSQEKLDFHVKAHTNTKVFTQNIFLIQLNLIPLIVFTVQVSVLSVCQ
jgi:hypothetical protein